MARTASRRLTYEDLLALPDDGLRHELIDGEHYVTPAPNLKHQAVVANLTAAIVPFMKRHDLGRLFTAPCDVVFSPSNVVEPDLLFVSRERLGLLTEQNVQGAPDLVIEVLSPSTRKRDEGIKRQLYDRMGVREYWLVEPSFETIEVFRRIEGALRRVAELAAESGDVLTTPLLPGLEIPVAEIFW
ncbi:MAG TPA: Uma2 family endonuclease [Thermoanaerobaculia bacterium]|nr:Uma2 family endonuclease [Thermoanaerobaculia bacterium]